MAAQNVVRVLSSLDVTRQVLEEARESLRLIKPHMDALRAVGEPNPETSSNLLQLCDDLMEAAKWAARLAGEAF
jgi:hypothetical protein